MEFVRNDGGTYHSCQSAAFLAAVKNETERRNGKGKRKERMGLWGLFGKSLEISGLYLIVAVFL